MATKITKTPKYIRLNPVIAQQLSAYAAETGESETLIIEQSLQHFFDGQKYDQIADVFLEKFDEKYQNYMTRVRLASRGADQNTQVLLEIINTLLYVNEVQPDFLSTDKMEHPIMKKARSSIKERIANFKQRIDEKRI